MNFAFISESIVERWERTCDIGPRTGHKSGMMQFMVSAFISKPPGCPVNITFNALLFSKSEHVVVKSLIGIFSSGVSVLKTQCSCNAMYIHTHALQTGPVEIH